MTSALKWASVLFSSLLSSGRGTDLLKGGAGTLWQLGTLSVIKTLGLLYFLAYFSAQNPDGVEQCKSEKLSWV